MAYGLWDIDFHCGLEPSKSEADLGVVEFPEPQNQQL